MIVISNTSPIINLATIGQLILLQQLYGKVVVPGCVYNEIVITGRGQPGAELVEKSEWIETLQVKDQLLVNSLQLELDEGEAEAIVLAVELKADLILIDERKGRQVASRLDLHCIGLLGVLMEAKKKGRIPKIRPILDSLIKNAGFWIDPKLYERVLRAAEE